MLLTIHISGSEYKSSINNYWWSQTGKRWVLGQGLVSHDYQQTSLLEQSVEVSVSHYQRLVLSEGLWMSFSHPLPLTSQRFSQLESLLSHEAPVRGGSCHYWAGSHYRMFDGTLLSLPPGCGHVLVTEQRDNIFRIYTKSAPCNSNRTSCPLALHIEIESEKFVITTQSGMAQVLFNGQSIAVPGLHNGLVFQKVKDWIFIDAQGVGFKIRWNMKVIFC